MFDATIVLTQDIRSGLLMRIGRNGSNRTQQSEAEIFDLTQDISSDKLPGTDQRYTPNSVP